MKRIVSVALVLLLLAAIVPVSSMAAGAVSNGTRKVYHVHTYGGTLNLRRGPGMSYSVIGSLCNGTALVKKDCSGSWWKVRTMNGREGWVSSKYVREHARANVCTRESGLNVRSSRCTSSSSNILYSIPHGTKGITVYKVNCDWAYVKWGCHQKGWASLRYLKWTRW